MGTAVHRVASGIGVELYRLVSERANMCVSVSFVDMCAQSGQLDKVAQPAIVQAIMERAAEFLPGLKSCKVPTGDAVRVGPRPYAVGGMPFIGPVPGQTGELCPTRTTCCIGKVLCYAGMRVHCWRTVEL